MNTRIKKLRKSLDLTQVSFAEKIGLKQNSIALIESGKRNISDQAILSICREFNVNEEWLRDGTGEMFVPKAADELEAIARKYEMNLGEQVFLEKYLQLSRSSRDTVMAFLMDVMHAIGEADPAAGSSAGASDLDIDAEVEDYRRQLELQKKAAAESSRLPGGVANGENKKEA